MPIFQVYAREVLDSVEILRLKLKSLQNQEHSVALYRPIRRIHWSS